MGKVPEFFNQDAKVKNKPVSKDNPIKESSKEKPQYEKEINEKRVEQEILKSISNVATEFHIDILKPTFLEKIKREKIKTFKVKKITLSRVAAITEILKSVDFLELDGLKEDELSYKSMELATVENITKVIRIISIFLTGKESKKTIDFLMNNLEMKDTLEFAMNIIKLSGYQDFMLTTSLLKANLSMKTARK
jgi:hypothetical protein